MIARVRRLPRDGRARLEQATADPLLRNGLYIMATTIVTAAVGFVFWIVAARSASADEVGVAAALISAMLLVALLTNLGFSHVFIARLASRASGPDWSLTVCTGLLVTGVVSMACGLLAAVLLPTIVPAVDEGVGVAVFVLLPLGVTGAAWSFLIDYACIAERLAKPAFLRNGGMAVGRLLLLCLMPLLAVRDSTWVVATWVLMFLVFNALGLLRVLPALGRRFRVTLRGWRGEFVAMRGLLAGHHIINVGAQAPPFILPVVVSAQLGAAENAYFYTTWMVATIVFLVAPSISNSLFAEGAHHPERLDQDLRRAIRQFIVLAGPPAVLLLLVGPTVLTVFGDDYGQDSRTLLLVLVGAAVFDAGQSLAVAVLRVRHQLRDAAMVTLLAVVLAVAGAWVLLPPLGSVGAAVGLGVGRAVGMVVGVSYVRRRHRPDSVVVPTLTTVDP